MIIAFRKKTGCRQYIFDNVSAMCRFFSKPCYENEVVKAIVYSEVFKKELYTITFNTNDIGFHISMLSKDYKNFTHAAKNTYSQNKPDIKMPDLPD